MEEVRDQIRDNRVRSGLDQLLRYADEGARFSWIQEPKNISRVCNQAINARRRPNSVRRSLFRAISDLLTLTLGKSQRQSILAEVNAPYEDDQRNVDVSGEQIRVLVKLCLERDLVIAVVALLTGIDRGPLMKVMVAHWNTAEKLLTVPDEKASERFRILPIPPILAAVLDRLVEGKAQNERLFPHTTSQIRDRWEAIRDAAGVKELRFKDLRHVFASNYLRGGGELRELQSVLGHASVKTTMRYLNRVPRTSEARMEAALATAGISEEDLMLGGDAAPSSPIAEEHAD